MKQLRHIWEKASLQGTKMAMEPLEHKRIVLTNRLSLILFSSIFLGTATGLGGIELSKLIAMMLQISLFLIPFLLNVLNKTLLSRHAFIWVFTFMVVIMGATSSDGSERNILTVQMHTMAMVGIPFLVFDIKNKKSLLFYILLILISYFATPFLHENLRMENNGISNNAKHFYLTIIAPILGFVCVIGAFYSSQVLDMRTVLKLLEQTKDFNKKLEKQVEERTTEVMNKAEEIEQQNEEIIQKNEQLARSNQQITDSITYASRIQSAILGDTRSIEKEFGEAFIFFSPHSIVSGDFYWYANTADLTGFENQSGLKIIIAADCTGHGVPGAFMTVMGHDFLEEIVKTQQITMPDKILSELDHRVSSRLQKQNSGKRVNDGMDISVLVFDEVNKKVLFSGAKNPLYYIREGEMQIIKGSKFAIGGNQVNKRKKEFDLHEINLQKGDLFYIFSDGFQDQFSMNGHKYLTKNFRNFLHENSALPLLEQKQKLRDELQNWKGNNHQTDDILIIGIKADDFELSTVSIT